MIRDLAIAAFCVVCLPFMAAAFIIGGAAAWVLMAFRAGFCIVDNWKLSDKWLK